MSAPVDDPLAREHQRLRDEARAARREFARSPEGSFARTMQDAITDYLKARDEGVSREDALKGLEAVVRSCWPRGRNREWKYLCDTCDDTGWEYRECRPYRRCQPKHDDWPSERTHTYVTPCQCEKGDRFRKRAHQLDQEQELTQIAKRKKASGGFSRIGRR